MKKLLLVLAVSLGMLSPGTATALTVEEAVDLALKNNNRVRQFQHLESSRKEGVGTARSEFYPSLDISYLYTDSTEEVSFTQRSVFTAEAAYNLFNGFADRNSLREAKARARASFFERKSTVADVVLEVRSAYIEVLRTTRAVETAGEGVELLEQQLRDTQLFYREGLLPKNDVLEVGLSLASNRQDLLQAKRDRTVAVKRLERVAGARLSAEETFEEFREMGTIDANTTFDFDALREEMFGRRSELKFLKETVEANRYAMKSVRGEYLPALDIRASYNQFHDIASAAGSQIFGDKDEEAQVAITASWNLFSGFETKHESARFHYLARAAEAELADTEEELILQLQTSLENFDVSRGKLAVAGVAIDQGEENYRVVESQFKERVATSTDLLDARFLLTRAKNQYNDAVNDLRLSAAQIERVLERGPGLPDVSP
jgi:outer membrane protein TolC